MVKLGIIGCGYWGPNLLRNFVRLKGAEVEFVADLREERLQYVKNNYQGIKTTQDYKEMLNEVEALVIATPASTHYELAKEALIASKNVLVEKPLAMSEKEASELVKLAEERKKVLMVSHTFMYNRAVNFLKNYLESEALGEIYYIYSQRLNLGIVRSDVDVMWNLAPHDVSILIYLLGSAPIQVSGYEFSWLQKKLSDVAFLTLTFPKNIIAHIQLSWLEPNKVRKMVIVGSKKTVVYDDVSEEAKIQIYGGGIGRQLPKSHLEQYDTFSKFLLVKRAGGVEIPKIDFVEPLKVECEHFIECIKESERPISDGYNGLAVVKTLERVQKSLKSF